MLAVGIDFSNDPSYCEIGGFGGCRRRQFVHLKSGFDLHTEKSTILSFADK